MLCLSRRNGESILIDGKIRVTVYAKGKVQLGIEAPRDIAVVRDNTKQGVKE